MRETLENSKLQVNIHEIYKLIFMKSTSISRDFRKVLGFDRRQSSNPEIHLFSKVFYFLFHTLLYKNIS